ncbi:MAG TPA: sulfotransferase [Streptosporangiaceae bacterium]|nr:sulfotransferase [Streptosporangiaceae bacterium]
MSAIPGQQAAMRLDEPVIILACARTGSTLLRFILDSHPELACPPETNLAKTVSHHLATWKMLNRCEQLPTVATSAIRAPVDRMLAEYLSTRGRLRWCDKSLGTAEVAAAFLEVYPQAQFICLYRHCMDMIASGIEACPWGMAGYGFEPYASNSPGNNVAALAHYWADHTTAILEFEEAHPGRCQRVYYEDLAISPEITAKEIFKFLGVVGDVPAASLTAPYDLHGSGDYKIWATSQITGASVGRGVAVPTDAIPAPLLGAVNGLLGKLGYVQVDDQWNLRVGGGVLTRQRQDLDGGQAPAEATDAAGPDELEAALTRRIRDSLARRSPGEPRSSDRTPAWWRSAAIVITAIGDGGSPTSCSWVVDLSLGGLPTRCGPAPGQGDWLLAAETGTWHAVLDGRLNFGLALRQGRVRSAPGPRRAGKRTEAPVPVMAALLGISPHATAGPAT